MVKTKALQITILCTFLLAILALNVNAFGISSPHWDENPLSLYPGDVKEFTMVLQNMVGGEDITVEAKVNSGHDIMKITDQSTIYKVPLGSNNIPVHLKVTVPQDAKAGEEFQVGVSFKTIADNKGGVALGTEVSKGFKVKIIEKQPEVSAQASKQNLEIQPLFGFIIGIIALAILLIVLRKFHKI